MRGNPVDCIGNLIVLGITFALGIGGVIGIIWAFGFVLLAAYDKLIALVGA